jgi:hypothetical protein
LIETEEHPCLSSFPHTTTHHGEPHRPVRPHGGPRRHHLRSPDPASRSMAQRPVRHLRPLDPRRGRHKRHLRRRQLAGRGRRHDPRRPAVPVRRDHRVQDQVARHERRPPHLRHRDDRPDLRQRRERRAHLDGPDEGPGGDQRPEGAGPDRRQEPAVRRRDDAVAGV